MNHEPNEFESTTEAEAQLTAFVLGELPEPDAAAVARRIEADDALRRDIDAIRATVAQVDEALADEPAPGLSRDQREAIIGAGPKLGRRDGVLFSFLSLRTVWAGGGLVAAACLAIAVVWPAIRSSRQPDTVAMQRTEAEAPAVSGAGMEAKFEQSLRRANELRQSAAEDSADAGAKVHAIDGKGDDLKEAEQPRVGGRRIARERVGGDGGAVDRAAGRNAPVAAPLPAAGQAMRGAAEGAAKKRRAPGMGVAGADEVFRAEVPDLRRDAPARAITADDLDTNADSVEEAPESSWRTLTLGMPLADPSEASREAYGRLVDNAFRRPTEQPLSTFAIDVDTAAYANVRRFIDSGRLPPKDAVRIEELINYFDYDYEPATGAHPFSVTTEVNPCPWNTAHQLVRIGLRGRDVERGMRPATNLEMAGTIVTIAKDVSIQVEFNPLRVGAYRLIGYANRLMAAQDFDDDRTDAGEIGAGHTVTALYEIVPPDLDTDDLIVTERDLRSPGSATPTEQALSNELAVVELRYKAPDADASTLIRHIVPDAPPNPRAASADFMFAAAVAGFGMQLRDAADKGAIDYDLILELAGAGAPSGDRTVPAADAPSAAPPESEGAISKRARTELERRGAFLEMVDARAPALGSLSGTMSTGGPTMEEKPKLWIWIVVGIAVIAGLAVYGGSALVGDSAEDAMMKVRRPVPPVRRAPGQIGLSGATDPGSGATAPAGGDTTAPAGEEAGAPADEDNPEPSDGASPAPNGADTSTPDGGTG